MGLISFGNEIYCTKVLSFKTDTMKLLPLILLPLLFKIFCTSTKTQMDRPAHHTDNGFINPYSPEDKTFGDFLKWQWQTIGKTKKMVAYELAPNDPAFLRQNKTIPTLTWIGHAAFLIQHNGTNILTDPIFSERSSPVQWAGPKRTTPPGLALDSLPPIDIIVISHNHYDHLDKGTVLKLNEQLRTNPPKYIVPLGVKEWFDELNIPNVEEYDWWENVEIKGWNIHSVPLQHFSGRTLSDRNETLWSGWTFRSEDFNLFFGGDTGYSPDFKDIGNRLGPFDLALIPIGAYDPRWFMGTVHVDPEQAVLIHKDIKSSFSVGMHWGSFALADEDMDAPPKELEIAK